MEHKKIIIFGAGAVGGYFGALMYKNTSHDVLFVARGTHYNAIKKNGLTIKSANSIETFSVTITDSLNKKTTPADIILLAVKSLDTDTAIRQMKPVVNTHTQILTIQNGLENYDKLVKYFGTERVIRGMSRIGVEIVQPGIICHSYHGLIVFGEENGEKTPRITKLEQLFENSNIEYKVSSNIRQTIWKKFAWNSIFNILSGITGITLDKLYKNPETLELCRQILDEIQLLASKEGVTMTDSDIKWILTVAKDIGPFRTSTLQDRERGKRLEYDAFTGHIVRLAHKHAVNVPANKILLALIKAVDS